MKLLSLIHTYNYVDLIIPSAILIACVFISPLLFVIGLHFFLFVIWSLRQKSRHHKPDPRNYLSPVDGIVVDIKQEATLPHLEGIWKCVQISTYSTDSHIQYSPISGSIISTQEIENDISFSYLNWMHPGIAKVFKTVLSGFMQEGILVTEINNIVNQSHCIVQTSVECRLKWIDICNYLLTQFNLANNTKYSCAGALRRIMTNGTIDEGVAIAVLGLGGVCGKMTTWVYIPINVDLKVQVGQTVIAAETAIAQGPGKIASTINMEKNTENLMTFVSRDNVPVIG